MSEAPKRLATFGAVLAALFVAGAIAGGCSTHPRAGPRRPRRATNLRTETTS
jgi:hypothetical protein